MRKSEFNNFELLLMTAAEATANDYADAFMSIETENVEMSPKAYAKTKRYIRKNSRCRANWYPAKVILIACLIAMSVAFTACVCIPQIREAIKNVVVQWYDDYFSISFTDDPNAITTTQPEPEEVIPEAPPTRIEKKAYAEYIPNNYKANVVGDTSMYYMINYYDDADNLVIMFKQGIIDSETMWNDEGVIPKEITINGHKAYLLTYPDEPNVYTLIWQDYYYQYNVYGMFASEEKVIEFCENVRVR